MPLAEKDHERSVSTKHRVGSELPEMRTSNGSAHRAEGSERGQPVLGMH